MKYLENKKKVLLKRNFYFQNCYILRFETTINIAKQATIEFCFRWLSNCFPFMLNYEPTLIYIYLNLFAIYLKDYWLFKKYTTVYCDTEKVKENFMDYLQNDNNCRREISVFLKLIIYKVHLTFHYYNLCYFSFPCIAISRK